MGDEKPQGKPGGGQAEERPGKDRQDGHGGTSVPPRLPGGREHDGRLASMRHRPGYRRAGSGAADAEPPGYVLDRISAFVDARNSIPGLDLGPGDTASVDVLELEASSSPHVCVDVDGDGFGSPGTEACEDEREDCDDSDAAVNPDAEEIPGNVVDENCDTILDCDPAGDWENHGQYVRCVVHEVNELRKADLISEQEANDIVTDAAQSDVGK